MPRISLGLALSNPPRRVLRPAACQRIGFIDSTLRVLECDADAAPQSEGLWVAAGHCRDEYALFLAPTMAGSSADPPTHPLASGSVRHTLCGRENLDHRLRFVVDSTVCHKHRRRLLLLCVNPAEALLDRRDRRITSADALALVSAPQTPRKVIASDGKFAVLDPGSFGRLNCPRDRTTMGFPAAGPLYLMEKAASTSSLAARDSWSETTVGVGVPGVTIVRRRGIAIGAFGLAGVSRSTHLLPKFPRGLELLHVPSCCAAVSRTGRPAARSCGRTRC